MVAACLSVGLSMWRRPVPQTTSQADSSVPSGAFRLALVEASPPTAESPPVFAPRVAVDAVKVVGCRGGSKRRAHDACDRPAAALDAFSRAVAATQDCAGLDSRPLRVEYILRFDWTHKRASLEMRSGRSGKAMLPADRAQCISRIRDYFLSTTPADSVHAASEYRFVLTADYIRETSKKP